MDKPSVGRIVHYVAYGTPKGEFPSGVHRAAIITEVINDVYVCLCVLNPSGMFFDQSVRMDGSESPSSGTWHWPERV